ncbi:hypothetical protein [Salinibaculum salinum]|uniref:hypothetical protein n=1 Tax=Salinibaculum salinum TaxID=3131996 RepID=UPI0030EC5343
MINRPLLALALVVVLGMASFTGGGGGTHSMLSDTESVSAEINVAVDGAGTTGWETETTTLPQQTGAGNDDTGADTDTDENSAGTSGNDVVENAINDSAGNSSQKRDNGQGALVGTAVSERMAETSQRRAL